MTDTKSTNQHFCTLFDSAYLLHGLALYRSLEQHVPKFHLYIYAFDDRTAAILEKLKLQHATVVPLASWEDKALQNVKAQRTKTEYFWTCTPSIIHHAITRFGLEHCTYLDADLLFFADPAPLFLEAGDRSVLIVPHRYLPEHDKTDKVGTYCVQFNMFRNTEDGMRVLNWWKNACIDWCYARLENGKFGDQKYLDDWPQRFVGVHELRHIGGGVAPWNAARYRFEDTSAGIEVYDRETEISIPLVFYHYQHTGLFNIQGNIRIKSYPAINADKNIWQTVYSPYERAMNAAWKGVLMVDPEYRPPFNSRVGYIKETIREALPSSIKRALRVFVPRSQRQSHRLVDHSS